MSRPALEVADIFREHGAAWGRANAGHVSLDRIKVMRAIERCRTVALGGHVARCEGCANAYKSCRNRHCPKCQGAAAREWLEEREAELLPAPYFQRRRRSLDDAAPVFCDRRRYAEPDPNVAGARSPRPINPVKSSVSVVPTSRKTDARSPQIPIDRSSETEPLLARDFVLWRFSDACRGSARGWFCDEGVRETCTTADVAVKIITTLKEKLIKIGMKLVSLGGHVAFPTADVANSGKLFADILRADSGTAPAACHIDRVRCAIVLRLIKIHWKVRLWVKRNRKIQAYLPCNRTHRRTERARRWQEAKW